MYHRCKRTNSCSGSIIFPKLGTKKYLNSGENVIEFTPNSKNSYHITCAMGAPRDIQVVE